MGPWPLFCDYTLLTSDIQIFSFLAFMVPEKSYENFQEWEWQNLKTYEGTYLQKLWAARPLGSILPLHLPYF